MTSEYAVRDEMRLIDFLRILVHYKWSIIMSMAACTAMAGAYAMLKTPLYSATVTLLPAQDDASNSLGNRLASLGGIVGLGKIGIASSSNKDEAIAVLKSRKFTEAFIRDRNMLPDLYPKLWDANKDDWRDPNAVPTIGGAFRKFDQRIRFVQEDAATGMITLEILWSDPVQAADWANDLIVRINRHVREIAIDESEKSLRFLNEQLASTELIDVRQAMFTLMQQHVSSIMLAKVRDEYAFKVIDPAVAPDAGNYVSPNRFLDLLVGIVGGTIIGVMIALARFLLRDGLQFPR